MRQLLDLFRGDNVQSGLVTEYEEVFCAPFLVSLEQLSVSQPPSSARAIISTTNEEAKVSGERVYVKKPPSVYTLQHCCDTHIKTSDRRPILSGPASSLAKTTVQKVAEQDAEQDVHVGEITASDKRAMLSRNHGTEEYSVPTVAGPCFEPTAFGTNLNGIFYPGQFPVTVEGHSGAYFCGMFYPTAHIKRADCFQPQSHGLYRPGESIVMRGGNKKHKKRRRDKMAKSEIY